MIYPQKPLILVRYSNSTTSPSYIFLFYSEEVDRYAKENRMRVYRTSVKEDINVGNVFQHLAENYVQRIRMEQDFLRFDIGSCGPRSLSIQIGASGGGEVDRVCNGSTSSNSSTSSNASTRNFGIPRKFSSNSSSGYFSLTNFGSVNSSGSDRSNRITYTPQNTTPQEYLNNPMFESLNSQRRLYWPSVIGSSSDRTITLKPLNVLKRKKSKSSLQKRLGFGNTTNSTPTANVLTNGYQQYPPPPTTLLSGKSNACKVL